MTLEADKENRSGLNLGGGLDGTSDPIKLLTFLVLRFYKNHK